MFCDFEFVVCLAPLKHEVERNIILDLGSTVDSVKSKRGSRDTPTFRFCLSEFPHGSVVGATKFHDLGTLPHSFEITVGPLI